MKMLRVIYAEIEGCKDCLYNKNSLCYELSRPVQELNYNKDCPLPTKKVMNDLTKYVTKSDKSIKACGNCQHWERWAYNRNLETEVGICDKGDILLFCHCGSDACESFKEG